MCANKSIIFYMDIPCFPFVPPPTLFKPFTVVEDNMVYIMCAKIHICCNRNIISNKNFFWFTWKNPRMPKALFSERAKHIHFLQKCRFMESIMYKKAS